MLRIAAFAAACLLGAFPATGWTDSYPSRPIRFVVPFLLQIWLFATPRPGELLCNCTRVIGPDGRELNPLIAADFTDAEIEGLADYYAAMPGKLQDLSHHIQGD